MRNELEIETRRGDDLEKMCTHFERGIVLGSGLNGVDCEEEGKSA